VSVGDGRVWREFPGVVDAARKADLGFRVGGSLEALSAKEGDDVAEGSVLARLDQSDFRIKVNSAAAEFERARAELERAEGLVGQGHISRSDYDKLKAQFATAKSNLDAARQNLEYTVLTAPFAGRIAERHVDNYEEVAASQPVYTLHDASALTVRVAVPESVMINVRRDRQRRAYALFDAIPGREFPLEVKEAATRADPETQTYEVTLLLEDRGEHNILPGMSVRVRGEKVPEDGDEAPPPVVPARAVLDDGGGRYVFVAEPVDDRQGVVRRRAVEVGRLTDAGLEIRSGLADGESVVSAGMSKMRDGLRVRMEPGGAP
jgi:RND family efflux transporter MFP subunit